MGFSYPMVIQSVFRVCFLLQKKLTEKNINFLGNKKLCLLMLFSFFLNCIIGLDTPTLCISLDYEYEL